MGNIAFEQRSIVGREPPVRAPDVVPKPMKMMLRLSVRRHRAYGGSVIRRRCRNVDADAGPAAAAHELKVCAAGVAVFDSVVQGFLRDAIQGQRLSRRDGAARAVIAGEENIDTRLLRALAA